MIKSKYINIIIAIVTCFALIASVLMIIFAQFSINSDSSTATEPEYATEIFGEDIISIDILADEDEWQEMLDNAISEQFIMVDVVVNGTTFTNVGIRPKGNSSLTQVANDDTTDRFSFRLQFDEYIDGQTCFGLQSFVVNNMIGDSTYMKEYVSYDMMKEMGVDCPYFGFADINLNGENWGFYLAVELYNESYEMRVEGNTQGSLYNVKIVENDVQDEAGVLPDYTETGDVSALPGGTETGDVSALPDGTETGDRPTMPGGTETGDLPALPDGTETDDLPALPGGSGIMDNTSGGGSLEYTDDNSSSYSNIFDNVIGTGTESEYQQVIAAIKALSEGTDLEEYFEVDEILRYLAAHNFVVNLDSYNSSMLQNYYIYENNGVITILPWDYNLAWGGFQSDDASAIVNFPIDTPVSGVEMSERPLFEKLFANEEYFATYHSYLQELVDNYFTDGKFEAKINSLNDLISDYVKNDSTAFYTYEEYQKGVETFITLGTLRSESVQGQLDGTVPSTTEGQASEPDKLISAGNINLSDLGEMASGAGDQQVPDQIIDSDMPDIAIMQQVMQIITDSGGEITDDVKAQLVALGLTDEQIEMVSSLDAQPPDDVTQAYVYQPIVQNNVIVETETTDEVDTGYIILVAVLFAVTIIITVVISKIKKTY